MIKNGYIAKTHAGVINLLGLHFVNKGLVDKKLGHFYSKLFELRQSGDYDAWTYIEEKDVTPLLEPAENFIASIEKLIELGV